MKKHLIPLLKQGTVVVMDNASFHRKNRLNDIAKKYGIKIIFLPPYSPELNPMEHF
ncbi:MAG: transposase [Synergistaceae bacterium]|nr:transposase [Synergistaceae bacterium]